MFCSISPLKLKKEEYYFKVIIEYGILIIRHSLQTSCVLGDFSSYRCAHCAFSLSGEMGGETCIESELFEERVPDSKHRYTAGYVSRLKTIDAILPVCT